MELKNNLVKKEKKKTSTKMIKLLGRAKEAALDCYFLATGMGKFILLKFPRT